MNILQDIIDAWGRLPTKREILDRIQTIHNIPSWAQNELERRRTFMELIDTLDLLPEKFFHYSSANFDVLLAILSAFLSNSAYNVGDFDRAEQVKEKIGRFIAESANIRYVWPHSFCVGSRPEPYFTYEIDTGETQSINKGYTSDMLYDRYIFRQEGVTKEESRRPYHQEKK